MRPPSAFRYLLSAGAICVCLTISVAIVRGQSQTIEPCPVTPSPVTPTTRANPTRVSTDVKETLVDSSIPDDPTVEQVLSSYTAKVRALDVVIGNVDGELKTGGVGASTMGHFVADAMRSQARVATGKPVTLVLTNGTGLRKASIPAGEIRATDIFELLPFENELIQIDVTGTQLMNLLQHVTSGRDAQAGARIHFRWNDQNRPELISAKLIDDNGNEQPIDPQARYTIVTIDYLLKLGSGSYSALQEGTNVKPLKLTIRSAVIDYVKSETAAGRKIHAQVDDRFVQEGPSPKSTETPRND